MPPVVSIVGSSGTGKTTLIVKLIRELTARGYRVATVKHTHHPLGFDRPDKDSRRHIEAGSRTTAVSAPDELLIIRPSGGTADLDRIIRYLGEDCDLIITEGFKSAETPKIEVYRREIGPPLTGLSHRIALVTDDPADIEVKTFKPDDVRELAGFLEQGFILPRRHGQ